MKPHYSFWPARVPHHITPPANTLWDNLFISAQRFPHKTALQFLGTALSYQALAHQAERIAAWLQAQGVQKGDRVLLDMQNCPQLVAAHFGILRANAVVVPINPMNRAKELEHYISDAQARIAITTADVAAEMAAASDALPFGEGLQHLLVTHYSDAFDPSLQAQEGWPMAWQAWLTQSIELPLVKGGLL